MTRTKAATATVTATPTLRDRKAAAVAKVVARRRPPAHKTIPGMGADTVRVELDNGSPFLEPLTADQWADDRQARTPIGEPVSDCLFQAWEMCRDGVDAVPQVIDFLADQIRDHHGRFGAFMVLNSVPAGPGGIGAQLVKQWQRQGLPVMPGPSTRLEPMDRNAPSAAARAVRYRSPMGNPA